jgi:metallophosphoesterase (TIGR03767 family)
VALTDRQTLTTGAVVNAGRRSPYRALARGAGEDHLVRTELLDPARAATPPRGRRPIACVAHMTDLHVGDVQSPARFEFLNREYGDPRFAELVPVQRPQEALTPHALDALTRTLNGELAGPVSGAPLELVLTGGDAIDNGQHNEVRSLIRLLDGGLVQPNSGAPWYEGVQSPAWPDDIFWVPDGRPAGADLFQRDHGFPVLPGLLERATRPFEAPGLRLPWLGCHGNHDSLCQGVGVMTPELLAALVAGRKPVALPEGFERGAAHETFVTHPEAFFGGPCIDVTPDLERRHCTLGEFVTAHDGVGGGGRHGFDDRNRRERTAFYVHDTAAVRFIVLDTACPAGSADLCMDDAQFLWLEERLMEVHSSFRAHDGRPVRTQAEDRIAVVISHHGSQAATSIRRHRHGSTPEADGRLLSTLLRFDNVVLWLNGHTHGHAIRPRPDPRGRGEGLWEVTTGSLVDWPCQARMIELFDAGGGVLGIASSMIDHDGPVDPGRAETTAEMAALHRQLAANVSWAGFGAGAAGDALDRNAIMLRRIGFAPA